MHTYSWVGYADFIETDPHIFFGRIEVFGSDYGMAIYEYTVRYKQVFPNEMDFREWVDDLETEEILELDEIFELFSQKFSKMKIQRLTL